MKIELSLLLFLLNFDLIFFSVTSYKWFHTLYI
jgi:hypothetical protein